MHASDGSDHVRFEEGDDATTAHMSRGRSQQRRWIRLVHEHETADERIDCNLGPGIVDARALEPDVGDPAFLSTRRRHSHDICVPVDAQYRPWLTNQLCDEEAQVTAARANLQHT